MGKFIASHVVINNVKAVGTYYKKETPFHLPEMAIIGCYNTLIDVLRRSIKGTVSRAVHIRINTNVFREQGLG